jgi:hypothetical protein
MALIDSSRSPRGARQWAGRSSELGDLAGQTGEEIAARWNGFAPRRRRDIARLLADVRLLPGTRYDGPRFNVLRLAPSRWVGDQRTWGEIWNGVEA